MKQIEIFEVEFEEYTKEKRSGPKTKRGLYRQEEKRQWDIGRRNAWLEFFLEMGVSCEVCGYDKEFEAIDFHHRDPSTKEYKVSTLLSRQRTHATELAVSKEILKCAALCANCHREHHANERKEQFNETIRPEETDS